MNNKEAKRRVAEILNKAPTEEELAAHPMCLGKEEISQEEYNKLCKKFDKMLFDLVKSGEYDRVSVEKH
jgi:hypothetical protein